MFKTFKSTIIFVEIQQKQTNTTRIILKNTCPCLTLVFKLQTHKRCQIATMILRKNSNIYIINTEIRLVVSRGDGG